MQKDRKSSAAQRAADVAVTRSSLALVEDDEFDTVHTLEEAVLDFADDPRECRIRPGIL